MARALHLVQRLAANDSALFPLSNAHYFETIKHGDPARRQRLGEFMFSIAGLERIADATQLLLPEIRASVRARLGLPPQDPPRPFGLGFAHVFPEVGDPYSSPTFRAEIARWGREAVENHLELETLTGPPFQLPARGIARPDDTFSRRQMEFEQDTRSRIAAAGATEGPDVAYRMVMTQEAMDLIEPLNELIKTHSIPVDQYTTREGLTQLLLSLPAKAAVTRMRYTAHQNPAFKWSIGDLHDLIALGTAAGYCDIAVCEKHWGSILQRHQSHLRARILTSIRQLPQHITPDESTPFK